MAMFGRIFTHTLAEDQIGIPIKYETGIGAELFFSKPISQLYSSESSPTVISRNSLTLWRKTSTKKRDN